MTFKGLKKHVGRFRDSPFQRQAHSAAIPRARLPRACAPDDAFTIRRLKSTFRASRRNTGATPEKRGQIRIDQRRASDALQIARDFKTREERVSDFASRHTLLAVAGGVIA